MVDCSSSKRSVSIRFRLAAQNIISYVHLVYLSCIVCVMFFKSLDLALDHLLLSEQVADEAGTSGGTGEQDSGENNAPKYSNSSGGEGSRGNNGKKQEDTGYTADDESSSSDSTESQEAENNDNDLNDNYSNNNSSALDSEIYPRNPLPFSQKIARMLIPTRRGQLKLDVTVALAI